MLIEGLRAGDGSEMGSHFRIQWSARLTSEGHLIWDRADKKGPAMRRRKIEEASQAEGAASTEAPGWKLKPHSSSMREAGPWRWKGTVNQA